MGANWGQGAQGAAGGAAVGTAILPGWGTAIGAGVGGLMGLFGGSSNPSLEGYSQRRDQLQAGIMGAQGRGGAQIGEYERSAGGQEFRTGQQQLVNQLQLQASGRGPSLAGMQAQQVAQQSLAQQQAMAAGAGPGNEAMAARQAAMNAGGTMQGLAQTSAQARMAEQINARQQLAGVLSGARGQDIGNEQFNAGNYNQRQAAQAQLNQQNMGRNDEYELAMRKAEFDNALAKAGMFKGNSTGTQLMSGGANVLAMYGTGGLGGGQGGQAMPSNNTGLDYNSLSQGYGLNGFTNNRGGV